MIDQMAEITNELMYEILKSIQAQIAIVREDMDSIKIRLTSVDTRLGLVHTDIIAGRHPEHGRAEEGFYKAVADGLRERLGLRREHVVIHLVEVAKENWSFGNGDAPYAS